MSNWNLEIGVWRLNSDRCIRLPPHSAEKQKATGNWQKTQMNACGNLIKHHGDLEMSRKKLDQVGAIKQFMS